MTRQGPAARWAIWAVRAALVLAGIGLGLLAQHTLAVARETTILFPPDTNAWALFALGAVGSAMGPCPPPRLRTA